MRKVNQPKERIAIVRVQRVGDTITVTRTQEIAETLGVDELHARLSTAERNRDMYQAQADQQQELIDQYRALLAEHYGGETV